MFQLGKIITAMVTPFDEQMKLDLMSAGKLIDYLIDSGSDGILLSGTTGESPTLSDEEKFALFDYAVKNYKDRTRIIAGTGSNDTQHSIELSMEAEKIGVEALLLVTPYYNKPTQAGLYEHFKAIAQSVKIPVIIYNVPSRTSSNIEALTCIKLSKIDNIIGVKEASGNLVQISEIIKGTDDNFIVYSGNDSDTLPILSIGGYGVISVASHIAGKDVKKIILAFNEGDYEQAAEVHNNLMQLFNALFMVTNPIPVKKALNLMNHNVGSVRLPLCEMDEEKCLKLQEVLKNYKLIK